MRVNATINIYIVDDRGHPYSAGGTLAYSHSGTISSANFSDIAAKLDKIDTVINETFMIAEEM